MTEPTEPVVQDQPPVEEPAGAVVELVERHTGPRHPDSGPGSIICPNHLRINGTAVYATADYPARINEILVDGGFVPSPFTVTVQLLARALSIGGQPAFDPGAEGGGESTSAAIVEIPNTGSLTPGGRVDEPYVLLNGKRIYIAGGVGIGEMATDGEGRNAAIVTMTLKVRRLIVDDEPIEPAPEPAEPDA